MKKMGLTLVCAAHCSFHKKETREENHLLTMAGMDNKHADRNNASGRMIGHKTTLLSELYSMYLYLYN